MWDINLKARNRTESHGHRQWTSGYQREGREGGTGVKGVKYVATKRNITLGGEHTCNIYDMLNCTLETY